MSIYVFLGPTMPVAAARQILDAEYLPPVAMGDVLALADERPTAIAIVDGFFEQTPAVWHKEILFALSKGIPVHGSSSMGALRAAELHCFGMRGCGQIFQDFRDGILEDDDEVAVSHASAEFGYRALSEAMVNIRAGLRRAQQLSLISETTQRCLTAVGKALFYAERSWSALLVAGRERQLPSGELDALETFVRQERPDQKREDAVLLLRCLDEAQKVGIEPPEVVFDFEPTVFWREVVETMRGNRELQAAAAGLGQPVEALRCHLSLVYGGDEMLMREALSYELVTRETRRLGLRPTEEEQTMLACELQSNDSSLDTRLAHAIAELELAQAALTRARAGAIQSFLPLVLARRGQWSETAAAFRRKREFLEVRQLSNLSVQDTGLNEEALYAWYERRFGVATDAQHELAARLGFASHQQFVAEAVAHYLSERDHPLSKPIIADKGPARHE